jgi:hypothetical integral membrane protein (TIGR02206 family)
MSPPPTLAALPEWAVTFRPFTWMHGVSLVWTLGLVIGSCWLGRRWMARQRLDLEQRLSDAWGGFVVCVNVWSMVYWNLPGQFDLKESLPLQLCDLACLNAPLVFLTHWRLPRAISFFWGVGLSTQAFVTPTLLEGPGHEKYYLFWLVHLGIVGSSVYDMVVRRYRPGVRDLLMAMAVTIVYALAMVGVNHFLQSNYGFIGNQLRTTPTVIDKLGPWPERVFIMAGIVLGGFVVMWGVATLVDGTLWGGGGGVGGGAGGRTRRTGMAAAKAGGRRGKSGLLLHCSKCGFDLSEVAQKSDHCPQCGTPITSPGV